MSVNQKQLEKEWQQLLREEQKFIDKNAVLKEKNWQKKVEKYVPEKLDETLKNAFLKAFMLIFEKGTGIIEKTYDKAKNEQEYKINEFAAEIKNDRGAIKKFHRLAKNKKQLNLAVSAAGGIGMGVFGMGLPDIPIFLGVLLKSIYEIAVNYGFSYETEDEQTYILKLIETALSHDSALAEGNVALNAWFAAQDVGIAKEVQMKKTAELLAQEMLYLKFVQGIPLIGVAGGISDAVYQKKITDYAMLKYKRRFLEKQMNDEKNKIG